MKQVLASSLAVLAVIIAPQVHAQSRYWDANGTAAGAGVTPNGTWGTNSFWNTDPAGGAGTFSSALSSSLTGVFSAGTDATGSYAVSLNGTQLAQAININYGNSFTLTNGTLALTRTTGSSTTHGVISTASTMTGTAEIASTIQLDTTPGNGAVLNLIAGNGSAATDLLISGAISNNTAGNTYLVRLGGAGNGRITSALNSSTATLSNAIQAHSTSAWTGTWTIAGNQSLGSALAVTLSADNNKLVMGDSTSDVQSWGGATTVSTNSAVLTIKSTATIGAVTLRGGGGTMAVGGSVSGGSLTMGGTGGSGVLQMADGSTGGSATFTGLTISGTGNKIVGAAGGTGTFTLNLASGTTTIGSGLTLGGGAANENNFNFAKAGAGSLTFSNAMTYTGATRIAAGQLQINSSGSIDAASAVQISNGAALVLARGTGFPLVFSNAISGAGGVIKTGGENVTLAASNAHTGGTTISNANLILAANNALGTGLLGIDSSAGVARLWVNGTTNTVTSFVLAGTNAQVIQNEGSGGS
jgi:autotransporter-associated beta strand protein